MLFVCRAIAADRVVPPWQGPDEPSHFALARLLTLPEGDRASARPALEREILTSMFEHHWWELYRVERPAAVPRSFGDVQGGIPPSTLLQPTYYWLAGMALRVTPARDVDGQYRALRVLSIALSVLTLVLGWAGTRLLVGDVAAACVVSLAALNPQFLLTAISVNPDVLINLCGAFVWWQAARLQQPGARHVAASVAVVLAAALTAAFAKRNGIPLLLTAVVIAALAFTKNRHELRPWVVATVAAVAATTVGMVLVAFGDHVGFGMEKVLTFWSYMLIVRRSLADVTLAEIGAFATRAIDSSWLIAGWMRYPAPDAWLWIARLLTIAGFAGAAVAAAGASVLRPPLALAWLFVGVQGVAMLAAAFLGASAPQGRYAFSALVPAAVLLWFGLHRWLPEGVRAHAAPAIVGAVALLDAIGFTTVLLPTYLPYQMAY